ncbi:MAG: DVU0298 family protein, partial [bacterium]
LAQEDRRTLNVLIGSSYDKEAVESWRAIKAIGAAVKAIVDAEYDFVRETIRRLLWSIREESGCIGWSAPEMLGEIVSADPKRFADITPIIASFHEEENFRAGVLYALSRIAEVTPEQVQPQRDLVIASLSDRNPLVQAYALIAIKKARIEGAETHVQQLVPSTTEVKVFSDDDFVVTSIGTIAADV